MITIKLNVDQKILILIDNVQKLILINLSMEYIVMLLTIFIYLATIKMPNPAFKCPGTTAITKNNIYPKAFYISLLCSLARS